MTSCTIGRRQLQCSAIAVLLAASAAPAGARDGEDALNVAMMHEGRIDLLLTDVMMPRMGGYELAECMTLDRPETRVLFMSGFTSSAIVHNGRIDPGTAFIQKPFTMRTLRLKIREVLDASQAPHRS